MSDPRLDPPLSMPTYAVRAPLARWLAAEAERAAADLGPYRMLDVGCGEMPYLALFQPHAREIIGMDTGDNPLATLTGTIEAVPADDASFDVVLCAQVLEHVDDPAQGVRELARVTRPGGRVLLSTHGAMVYHPNPVDLWRWTGAGLERLFRESGAWGSVTVSAGSGTASTLAMLNAIYLEHVLRRTPLRPLRGGVVSLLNRVARLLDRRVAALRDERPGTIAANYHVTANRGETPGSPTEPLLQRSDAIAHVRASWPAKPASGGAATRPGETPDPIDDAMRKRWDHPLAAE